MLNNKGALNRVDEKGIPSNSPTLLYPYKKLTIITHGFSYDSRPFMTNNPYRSFFPTMLNGLGFFDDNPNRTALTFGWHSAPPLFYQYKRMYMAADHAGERLFRVLDQFRDITIDLVAHSLGTKVLSSLLRWCHGSRINVEKVLLLGGAEYSTIYRQLSILYKGTKFMNIASRSDKILDKLGEKFGPWLGDTNVIGHNGLGEQRENWVDIFMDYEPAQKKIHEYALIPDFGGKKHDEYYKEQNMKFYASWLNGSLPLPIKWDMPLPGLKEID